MSKKVLGDVADTSALRRMKNLLELAQGKSNNNNLASSTEAEAVAASDKLQEMLLRFNLTESDLKEMGELGEDKVIEETIAILKNTPELWYSYILTRVADTCFCAAYQSQFKVLTGKTYRANYKMRFAGRKTNIIIARELFSYLTSLAYTLGYKKAKESGDKQNLAWYASFKQGFAIRIGERLREKQQRMTKEGLKKTEEGENISALVVASLYEKEKEALSKFFEERGVREGTKSSSWNIKDLKGYSAGHKAASSVSLQDQIENK